MYIVQTFNPLEYQKWQMDCIMEFLPGTARRRDYTNVIIKFFFGLYLTTMYCTDKKTGYYYKGTGWNEDHGQKVLQKLVANVVMVEIDKVTDVLISKVKTLSEEWQARNEELSNSSDSNMSNNNASDDSAGNDSDASSAHQTRRKRRKRKKKAKNPYDGINWDDPDSVARKSTTVKNLVNARQFLANHSINDNLLGSLQVSELDDKMDSLIFLTRWKNVVWSATLEPPSLSIIYPIPEFFLKRCTNNFYNDNIHSEDQIYKDVVMYFKQLFVDMTLPEEVQHERLKFIFQVLGLPHYGRTIEKMYYVLYNLRGNAGKTLLCIRLQSFWGQYYVSADISMFVTKVKANSPQPDLAQLKDKRLAVLPESTTQKLNMNLLKKVTGEKDIVLRELYGFTHAMPLTMRFLFHWNALPDADFFEETDQLRCCPIHMTSFFSDSAPASEEQQKQERHYPKKNMEEIPAEFHSVLMQLLKNHYQGVKIKTTIEQDELRMQFAKHFNLADRFIKECFIFEEKGVYEKFPTVIELTDLYDMFKKWLDRLSIPVSNWPARDAFESTIKTTSGVLIIGGHSLYIKPKPEEDLMEKLQEYCEENHGLRYTRSAIFSPYSGAVSQPCRTNYQRPTSVQPVSTLPSIAVV